jgi:dihydropteroate synthase
MDLRLAARTFGPGEFAIMADGPADGVDIALVPADPAAVRRVRREHPRQAIAVAPDTAEQAEACVEAGADLIVGDAFAGVAAATGAALACSAPERAAGVRPDGLLVTATDVAGTERLAEAGLMALTDEPEQAVMAVHAWLGARVFRTNDVHGTRQVLDMVASIRGSRAPAVARRGLA